VDYFYIICKRNGFYHHFHNQLAFLNNVYTESFRFAEGIQLVMNHLKSIKHYIFKILTQKSFIIELHL